MVAFANILCVPRLRMSKRNKTGYRSVRGSNEQLSLCNTCFYNNFCFGSISFNVDVTRCFRLAVLQILTRLGTQEHTASFL